MLRGVRELGCESRGVERVRELQDGVEVVAQGGGKRGRVGLFFRVRTFGAQNRGAGARAARGWGLTMI